MKQRTRILPFYMTYPLPLFCEEEDTAMRDLEYLQEIYPREAGRYHRKICRLLDRFDHEGSLIYDEFPDRLAVYKMAKDMMAVICREEREAGREIPPEKLPEITELVQVLMYNEIYRRRQAKGNGTLWKRSESCWRNA